MEEVNDFERWCEVIIKRLFNDLMLITHFLFMQITRFFRSGHNLGNPEFYPKVTLSVKQSDSDDLTY